MRKMKSMTVRFVLTAALGLVMGATGQARADLITGSFTGSVTNTSGYVGLSIGDAVSGSFAYDDHPGTYNRQTLALSDFLYGFPTVINSSYSISMNVGSVLSGGSVGGYSMRTSASNTEHDLTLYSNLVDVGSSRFYITLGDTSKTALIESFTNQKPPSSINLSQYSGGIFWFQGAQGTINTLTTSAASAVPEPSTLSLAGVAGLLGLAYRRSRRRLAAAFGDKTA